MKTIALLIGIAVLAGLAWVRFAPMSPEAWHVDPAAGARTGKPNDTLMADGGDRPALVLAEAPSALAQRVQDMALAQPRVTMIAGDVASGHMTFVQRSALMGYPDAISVKVEADGAAGSKLSIYSRSRFGHSDLGVNSARVTDWVGRLGLQ